MNTATVYTYTTDDPIHFGDDNRDGARAQPKDQDPASETAGPAAGWSTSIASDIIRIPGVTEGGKVWGFKP